MHLPSEAQDSSTNSWTKPTSGLWQEPFWSSGRLPGPDQKWIAITNAGSKTVEIGPGTTANFSNSLAINALQIEGQADFTNELFLNRAGTNVPLSVFWWLTIGTNAPLVSYSSALTAYEASISSPVLFAENSWVKIGRILLGADLTLSNSYASVGLLKLGPGRSMYQFEGSSDVNVTSLDSGSSLLLERSKLSIRNLYLMNSYWIDGVTTNGVATFVQNEGETTFDSIVFGMRGSPSGVEYGPQYRGEFELRAGSLRSGRMTFFNGSFLQAGGTNFVDVMNVPERTTGARGGYSLMDGTLVSGDLILGAWHDPTTYPPSPGTFGQGGGVHTNRSITLNGGFRYLRRFGNAGVIHFGTYSQGGGLLVSSNVHVQSGSFEQSGGTNLTHTLTIDWAGIFVLSGGELVTSNVVVDSHGCQWNAVSRKCFNTIFSHQEGNHVVQGTLELRQFARYSLDNGGLTARNIFIGETAALSCESGGVMNSGTFTLQGGVFSAGSGDHELGQLQVLEFGYPSLEMPEHPGALDLSGSANGVVRARDSHDVPWSASKLKITGWHGWDGTGTRLFIGTNAQSLTEEQLGKVVFVNPLGWGKSEYPARILQTGEIVPAVPPLLSTIRDSHGLILSWPGEYDLLRATNMMGPFSKVDGATSPMTNLISAPEQYFRLQLREH